MAKTFMPVCRHRHWMSSAATSPSADIWLWHCWLNSLFLYFLRIYWAPKRVTFNSNPCSYWMKMQTFFGYSHAVSLSISLHYLKERKHPKRCLSFPFLSHFFLHFYQGVSLPSDWPSWSSTVCPDFSIESQGKWSSLSYISNGLMYISTHCKLIPRVFS